MNLLECKNLILRTQAGRNIARIPDFSLQAGEIVFITGDNGSGKSTLLKTLLGIHPFYSGKIVYAQNAGKPQYLPQLAEDNIALPLTLRDVLTCTQPQYETYGLLTESQLDLNWNTASGGERRRLLLLRALNMATGIYFMDEPFNHLDNESVAAAINALKLKLKSSPDISLVIVSHQQHAVLDAFADVNVSEVQL